MLRSPNEACSRYYAELLGLQLLRMRLTKTDCAKGAGLPWMTERSMSINQGNRSGHLSLRAPEELVALIRGA
jgi:hypothetical protein